MYNKSNVRVDGVLESICVAAVQFPFIPVVIHYPETNWLSEPDGGINCGLVGGKMESNFPRLSSLPIPIYKDRIEEYLSSDYQNWLVRTVNGILDLIIKTKEDVDIILFPEYSLPLEINNELKNILKEHSEGRCIVGGIGSVCKNVKEDKKNRFVVANNGKLDYGEKIVPNNMEADVGIVGGEGPLIYEVSLDHAKEENRKIYVDVLMCSDYIETAKVRSKVQNQLNKEYSKKEIESDNINASLIPAFSTKTEDMVSIGKIAALRFHGITVLANCSFFGGSRIWSPPIGKGATISTTKIRGGESACVIANIPTKFLGSYASTSVGIPTTATPKTRDIRYSFRFKDEQEEKSSVFDLDSETLFSLITERLSSAITIGGIALARSSPDEESIKYIIESLTRWKRLQKTINPFTDSSGSPYESLRSSDIITFYEVMGESNLYKLILNKLRDHIPNDAYKTKVQEIMDYMDDKRVFIIPPTQWQYNEKQYQR
jgi:hypothetical protein